MIFSSRTVYSQRMHQKVIRTGKMRMRPPRIRSRTFRPIRRAAWTTGPPGGVGNGFVAAGTFDLVSIGEGPFRWVRRDRLPWDPASRFALTQAGWVTPASHA